jgi:hypothetical protein
MLLMCIPEKDFVNKEQVVYYQIRYCSVTNPKFNIDVCS